MKKFLVLYMCPQEVLKGWAQAPEAMRKEGDAKMRTDWDAWMVAHKDMFVDMGGGLGATKKITSSGVADSHNDFMLYSLVQGESAEAVAEAFTTHPHFGIPQASIEIMEARPMGGM